MKQLAAWLFASWMWISLPAAARATDLHEGLFLVTAPSIGSMHIDRGDAPKKQLQLGMQVGLAQGIEILWVGALLGVDYLEADRTLLMSAGVRGQLLLVGIEISPMIIHTDGRTGQGVRARAFIHAFYVGGSTIASHGSARGERFNTLEMGASLALPILIKRKK